MAKPMRALFRNPPLIALLLILAIPSGGWGAEKNDAGTPSAAVPPPAQIQELRAGLAASNRFYLELHLAERAFYLCHSGVTLRTYPFQDPSLGVAHILCFTKRADHPWLNSVWSYGNLDPPLVINRIKIQPGVESTRPTPDAGGDFSHSATLPHGLRQRSLPGNPPDRRHSRRHAPDFPLAGTVGGFSAGPEHPDSFPVEIATEHGSQGRRRPLSVISGIAEHAGPAVASRGHPVSIDASIVKPRFQS